VTDPLDEIRQLQRTIDRLESLVDGGDRLVRAEIDSLRIELGYLKAALAEKVTVSRYVVVERIVFGLVGLTLVTVFGALLALVIQNGGAGT